MKDNLTVTFLGKIHITTVSEFFAPLAHKCHIISHGLRDVISKLYSSGLDIEKLHQEAS